MKEKEIKNTKARGKELKKDTNKHTIEIILIYYIIIPID
jgi:hypothetical protein